VPKLSPQRLAELAQDIKTLGLELGFERLGIAGIELAADEARLERWLSLERHGVMGYMRRHGRKRTRPGELVPGTARVIAARMNYWPGGAAPAEEVLRDGARAYIARYALGRDYHKILRSRLKKLAQDIETMVGDYAYRVFVDSAPVLERALARDAGLGWIGTHTNLLDRSAGSYFLLGEIYTDLPLPVDRPVSAHCGTCRACLDVCPTNAIVAPYELDARRCISYLTIELKSSIPLEFRKAIGNRVFGCDDCQLFCPWNKYARPSAEPEFTPRQHLDNESLVTLFGWTEQDWSARTAGSAIRRPGYEGWLRNLAVGLGNAPSTEVVVAALRSRTDHASPLVREHVQWALEQHRGG
jgi:epoxyqueuosine reductase